MQKQLRSAETGRLREGKSLFIVVGEDPTRIAGPAVLQPAAGFAASAIRIRVMELVQAAQEKAPPDEVRWGRILIGASYRRSDRW
jgi:hypothetical protein